MSIELYQLNEHAPVTHAPDKLYQMMSYIIRADNGELILIDGGNTEDCEYLFERICQIGGNNPVISAWFISHCHSDHANAVVEMQKRHPEIVDIKKIYCNIPSLDDMLKTQDDDVESTYNKLAPFLNENAQTVQILKAGDIFYFGSVEIEALFVPYPPFDNVNATSVIYRMQAENQSVLFLGDADSTNEKDLLKQVDHDKLLCDFIQLGHHGQQGLSDEFYEKFTPRCALWCTPDWLWDNDFGDGFDTAEWDTIHTRRLMKKLGVKKHLISKDGEQKIIFPADFDDDSWGNTEL